MSSDRFDRFDQFVLEAVSYGCVSQAEAVELQNASESEPSEKNKQLPAPQETTPMKIPGDRELVPPGSFVRHPNPKVWTHPTSTSGPPKGALPTSGWRTDRLDEKELTNGLGFWRM